MMYSVKKYGVWCLVTTLIAGWGIATTNAQVSKKNSIWYFGYQAGLDFNTDNPTPQFLLDGQMSGQLESASTVSSDDGRILMYSDGISIWDSTHQKMPNADDNLANWNNRLSGDHSSYSGVLIAPVIGDNQRYYVFSNDGPTTTPNQGPLGKWDGLYYTVVDLRLNNGRGDIDTTWIREQGYDGNKIPLVDSTMEKLGVAKHANGTDYWIVTRRNFGNNEFYAFQISCKGVNKNPVITFMPDDHSFGVGRLKFNTEGTKLYETDDYKTIKDSGNFSTTQLNMYDFDNATGSLTRQISFNLYDTLQGDEIYSYYGCELSPNQNYLYVAGFCLNKGAFIDVFDVSADPPKLDTTLGYFPQVFDNILYSDLYDLELGTDGNIYYNTHFRTNSLTVIYNTNDPSAANIDWLRVSLGSGTTAMSFPRQFPYTDEDKSNSPVVEMPDESDLCLGDTITLISNSQELERFKVRWVPGKAMDDSTILNPIFKPDTTQFYTLYLVSDDSCALEYTFDTKINVYDTAKHKDVLPDTLASCDSIRLYTNDSIHFHVWSNLDTNNSISTSLSGMYTVEIKDSTGCYLIQDSSYALIYEKKGLKCTCQFFVPNAFSPNGDLENDIFRPEISCEVKEYRLMIYDRFGKLVFNTSDENTSWDGKYKNSSVNTGVYVYHLILSFKKDSIPAVNKIGNVTLLR